MGFQVSPGADREGSAGLLSHPNRRVKAAIFRCYDINEETYQQSFQKASLKENETYQDLTTQTMDLLHKWLKEQLGSVQQVLEQLAIEQLLGNLPQAVWVWVLERKPKTVLETGLLADDYVLVRKQANSRAWTNGKPKETETSSSKAVCCHYCNKRGHLARECRKAIADKTKKEGSQEKLRAKVQQKQGIMLQLSCICSHRCQLSQ